MKKLLLPALLLAALAGPALAQTPATSTAPAAKPAPAATTAPAATPAKPAALIDINTASTTELRTLKGVGEARAEAIVKGRPYKGKDDLLAKKIVPENVYNDIKDKIIARQKN